MFIHATFVQNFIVNWQRKIGQLELNELYIKATLRHIEQLPNVTRRSLLLGLQPIFLHHLTEQQLEFQVCEPLAHAHTRSISERKCSKGVEIGGVFSQPPLGNEAVEEKVVPEGTSIMRLPGSTHSPITIDPQPPPPTSVCSLASQMLMFHFFYKSEGKHWRLTSLDPGNSLDPC